jgi:general secretion pathway protein N
MAAVFGFLPAFGEEVTPPHGTPAPALQNPLAVHSLGELTATRDRPLFSPTRRPVPPPMVAEAEPSAAPPPPAPPDILFSGVVMEKKGALAIIRMDASSAPMFVRVGDAVSGWKVGQIARRQMVLQLGRRSATFSLFDHDKQTGQKPARSSHTARVFEVNAAGVLRSHRVATPDSN